ncbi:MAG: hypothetical protein V3U73_02300, partial [bacterium]
NIFGGYITGEDEDATMSYSLYFAEADIQLYPWLTGVLRYEEAKPKNQPSVRQIIPHISALYVANIKFLIETRLDPDNLEFNNFNIGMDFAF